MTKQENQKEPKLLSGGNPQIPKGDGDAAVQAYLDAMPSWKADVGATLDEIIMTAVPESSKAIKWNSPLYGIDGDGYFLSFHCLTKYVKVAFFTGALLDPVPPVASKVGETRYWHIYEDDLIDRDQFSSWVKQASVLPGWKP